MAIRLLVVPLIVFVPVVVAVIWAVSHFIFPWFEWLYGLLVICYASLIVFRIKRPSVKVIDETFEIEFKNPDGVDKDFLKNSVAMVIVFMIISCVLACTPIGCLIALYRWNHL